ncbi:hypothetical protein THAOC_26628, partial [Thalassiosira oceanica]
LWPDGRDRGSTEGGLAEVRRAESRRRALSSSRRRAADMQSPPRVPLPVRSPGSGRIPQALPSRRPAADNDPPHPATSSRASPAAAPPGVWTCRGPRGTGNSAMQQVLRRGVGKRRWTENLLVEGTREGG